MPLTWTTLIKTVDMLYGEYNQAMFTFEILARLLEEATELMDPIVNYNVEDIKEQLPDIFTWNIALVQNLAIFYPGFKGKSVETLIDEILSKYTNVDKIPFPFKNICKPESLRQRVAMFKDLSIDDSIGSWQQYFSALYGAINSRLSPTYFLNNLLLDLGTLTKIIRNNENPDIIKDKIASIFAWTFAIANKFGIFLDDTLDSKYLGRHFRNTNEYLDDFRLKRIGIAIFYNPHIQAFKNLVSQKSLYGKDPLYKELIRKHFIEKYGETITEELLSKLIITMHSIDDLNCSLSKVHLHAINMFNKIIIVTLSLKECSKTILRLSLLKPARVKKIKYNIFPPREYYSNVVILMPQDKRKTKEELSKIIRDIDTYINTGLLEIDTFTNDILIKKIVELLYNYITSETREEGVLYE